MFRAVPLTLVLAHLFAADALAGSDTHYQDVLIGDRAASMGGAFTALSGEATAAYYNPAGIIAASSTLIQVSMSAYKLRRKSAEVADLCGTRLQSDENAFFGFPASFGFVKQLGRGKVRHAVGLTVAVPYADKIAQIYSQHDTRCGPVALGMGGSNLMVDRTFWSGVTYAIRPFSFLQAGISAGLNIRAGSFSQLLTLVPDLAGTSSFPGVDFVSGEAKLLNLFFQLGVIAEPIHNLRFGLAVTPPQVRLMGSGSLDVMAAAADPTMWQQSFTALLDGVEYYWKVPLQVSIGAAYTIRERYTLSVDLRVHAGEDAYPFYSHPALEGQDVWPVPRLQRRPLANVSVGGEALVRSKLALRAGFFTNFTSQVPEAGGGQVNGFGFSAGASYLTPQSSFSLSVQTQIGTGDLQANRATWVEGAGLRQELYPVSVHDFSLIVSVGGGVDLH